MEMATPGDGHRRMAAFAGSWVGDETIHATPFSAEGGRAVGAMQCEVGVDGFFVVMDYQQTQEGRPSYNGHGLVGYEASTGEHLMWWFDSMGANPTGPSSGTWTGDTIAFVSHGPQGYGRYTYVFNEDDTITFKIEISQDGEQWAPFIDGLYRRAG